MFYTYIILNYPSKLILQDFTSRFDHHFIDWKVCPILKPAVKIHNIGNNIETLKETVKAIDEQNKSISFKMLDGELLDTMKNMKSNMQVSTKGDQSLVKWTIEYENANQELPARYLDFLPGWTEAIEAYLLNAWQKIIKAFCISIFYYYYNKVTGELYWSLLGIYIGHVKLM